MVAFGKFILRGFAGAAKLLLRLIASLILGAIIGLLAVLYLNTRGMKRERVVRLMALALGEKREAASTLNVRPMADGGFVVNSF